MTLLFCALALAYVAVIGNSIELGENNRFGLMVEPVGVAILAVGITEVRRCIKFRAGGITALFMNSTWLGPVAVIAWQSSPWVLGSSLMTAHPPQTLGRLAQI